MGAIFQSGAPMKMLLCRCLPNGDFATDTSRSITIVDHASDGKVRVHVHVRSLILLTAPSTMPPTAAADLIDQITHKANLRKIAGAKALSPCSVGRDWGEF
jgi:hypothetical protein